LGVLAVGVWLLVQSALLELGLAEARKALAAEGGHLVSDGLSHSSSLCFVEERQLDFIRRHRGHHEVAGLCYTGLAGSFVSEFV